MNIYITCVQETALDRLIAASPEIQNLHSLQCENFNLGISGSSGLRKSQAARRKRKQTIRLEFSWPDEWFKNYTFAFLLGPELGFFPFLYSSFDFPMEQKNKKKKVISLKIISYWKGKFFLLFLENVQDCQHTKLIFTPFHHYSCYNWWIFCICNKVCESTVRPIWF